MSLTALLQEEKNAKRKGGLYHKTQVNLAYNSNKIEGSKLTEEQTRCIFETRTIGFKEQEAVPVDDIIEASNHFTAFDILLDTVYAPLSNTLIKEFHRILKASTSDAAKDWFAVGDWKKRPNEVGGTQTTLPRHVETEMNQLNEWYRSLPKIEFEAVIEHHWRFEKIHPFQDGNGRLSRILTTLLLLRAGYGYVPYSSMESVIEVNKDNYYLALRRTQQTIRKGKQNWEYWLVFFLRTMVKQKNNLAAKVKEQQALRSSLPALSRQILELAKTRGEITVKEIEESTGANRNTIKVHLRRLATDNYLAQVGKGRGARYTLK